MPLKCEYWLANPTLHSLDIWVSNIAEACECAILQAAGSSASEAECCRGGGQGTGTVFSDTPRLWRAWRPPPTPPRPRATRRGWRRCGTRVWTGGRSWARCGPPWPSPPPTTSWSDTSGPGSWPPGGVTRDITINTHNNMDGSREAFDLRVPLLAYNLFQTVFNGWLFSRAWGLWWHHYNWRCQPVDYTNR